MKTIIIKILVAWLAIVQPVLAHNQVVVVPLGDDFKPLKNLITVAKENGDFTDPTEALASITDAEEENPYLVVIGPGRYEIDQQLIMKQHVDIVGSGKNSSIIVGNMGGPMLNSGASLIIGADYSSLSDLTILSGSSAAIMVGIFNDGTSPTLTNLNIFLEGDAAGYGVVNKEASVILDQLNINLFAGNGGIGILGITAQMTLLHPIVGLTSNQAIIGIGNTAGSDTTLVGGNITLAGNNMIRQGVFNGSASDSIRMHGTRIAGAQQAVSASSGSGANETYISNAVVEGSISGDPRCSFVFESDGTTLDAACNTP